MNDAPKIGEKWLGQGGIRVAAEIPATDGRFYDLVVVTDADDKPVILKGVTYGLYGTEVEGAGNYTDGIANAEALLKTNESPLAKQAAAVTSCDGQNDCYPPSIGEMAIVRATCPNLLPTDYYLSSTQDDADYAWYQYFGYGIQHWYDKDSKFSAFVVRRVWR